MRKLFLLFSFVMVTSVVAMAQHKVDSTYSHQLQIEEVGVVAYSPKQHFGLAQEPISSSVVSMRDIEREGVRSVKDLSAIMPNFYQPDYGSKMTSSIYVRGFGARIDQPVIGMSVDGVPYLNKNNYDFDLLDIARIELLRGPQSTLYGRNTMGGQMNIYTLSPLSYQGARASLEYSTGNTLRAKASYYAKPTDGFALSVAGYYNRTDGYFNNAFDGSDLDWGESSGGRLRTIWQLGQGWSIDNSISFGYNYEGGFAYCLVDPETGVVSEDANFNDMARYMRYNLSDGLVVEHKGDKYVFTSTTSYQFMHDRMRMDQDFTPASLFTLTQEQHEHVLTEELVLRTADNTRRWQWLTGAYAFYKQIDMDAPVNFLQDGINNLILGNMPAQLKQMLKFREPNILIDSNFDMPTYGLALYHESSLSAGERWRFTAGLRLDYEKAEMEYDNYSEVSYMMAPMIRDFRTVEVPFKGKESLEYLELLPKFAVNFTTGAGDLYVSATRGYKAGGFNTQIFSDILQQKMMTAMMADAMGALGGMGGGNMGGSGNAGGMGGSMGGAMGGASGSQGSASYDEASVTTYDPEYSWNYEVGAHLKTNDGRLNVDVAAFLIECRDQQLTVFPEGQTTGRMMSNAGESRSYGAEISARWDLLRLMSMSHLRLIANYGYTNAKFEEFNDGQQDYAGNYLPYAPQHTVSLGASYDLWIGGKALDQISFNATWQGAGKIYWDEANTLEQNFYSQLGASVDLKKGDFTLSLWGRNLTNTDFYTFYFKSVGNSFYNHGKPCRMGVTLSFAM